MAVVDVRLFEIKQQHLGGRRLLLLLREGVGIRLLRVELHLLLSTPEEGVEGVDRLRDFFLGGEARTVC